MNAGRNEGGGARTESAVRDKNAFGFSALARSRRWGATDKASKRGVHPLRTEWKSGAKSPKAAEAEI
jgi:hypothetical protein